MHVTSLTIRCHRSQRCLTDDNSLSLAKVTCIVSLTIGQESFSVSGHRCVHGMGALVGRAGRRPIVNNDIFPNELEIRDGSDAAWGWMFDRYPMRFGMHHPPFGSDGRQSRDSTVNWTMYE